MANTRALAIIAVLIVLAVALFGAIYGTRSSGSGNSTWNEFTASASIQNDYWNYTFQVYSKVIVNSDNQLQSWFFEGQVDYAELGVNYRHIYKNGQMFFGNVLADGSLNASACRVIDQENILQIGVNTFLPTKLDLSFTVPAISGKCDGCDAYNLAIAGEVFTMFTQGSTPRYLLSRDNTVTVTSFTPNAKTWSAPDVPPAWSDLGCVYDPNSPDAPSVEAPQSIEADSEDHSSARPSLTSRILGGLGPHIVELDSVNVPPALGTRVFISPHVRRLHGEAFALAHERAEMQRMDTHGRAALQATCSSTQLGDGHCDDACNSGTFNWDGGDCCPGTCGVGYNVKYSCALSTLTCKAEQIAKGKPCLFLHGVGSKGPRPSSYGPTQQVGSSIFGFKTYFGDMESQLLGACRSFEYVVANTADYGWNDGQLQSDYYLRAKATYSQNGIIFAHSMANLILGGACYSDPNKCNVHWVQLGGPIRGSKAANVLKWATDAFGINPGGGFSSLPYSVAGLANNGDWLATRIGTYHLLDGAYQGTSGLGSGGVAGVALAACKLAVYGVSECTKRTSFLNICVDYKWVEADGVVGEYETTVYNSGGGNLAGIGPTSFQTNWQNRNYKCDANHYDLTGVRGNHCNVFDYMRNMVRLR